MQQHYTTAYHCAHVIINRYRTKLVITNLFKSSMFPKVFVYRDDKSSCVYLTYRRKIFYFIGAKKKTIAEWFSYKKTAGHNRTYRHEWITDNSRFFKVDFFNRNIQLPCSFWNVMQLPCTDNVNILAKFPHTKKVLNRTLAVIFLL